jgi:hypothetical protein
VPIVFIYHVTVVFAVVVINPCLPMLLILVLRLGLAWFGAMDSITAVTALKANTTINCSAH